MKTLNTLVDATLSIEKLRVASEVRQSHLAIQHKTDSETDELHRRLVELEKYVDGRIATLLTTHPAYPWFSRVKGIGKENIGKVVGLMRVAPEKGQAQVCTVCGKQARFIDETCPDCDGELELREIDLPYARTISGLWKFAGFAVEGSHAPKRVEGEKLSYNSELRSMCWRVGSSLLKGRGKFYQYYLDQKEVYLQRFANQGIQVVPAAKLPKVNGKKVEGDGYISEGHIHNMALRKMIKLFLSCLWLSWREGEGLPVSQPYAIDQLKHTHVITPEMMTDR